MDAKDNRFYREPGQHVAHRRSDEVHEACEAARREEMERCARIAEACGREYGTTDALAMARAIADTIRRSGKGGSK